MAKNSETVRRIKELQGSMNQVEFARYGGFPQSRVSEWLAGKRPTADMYIRLGNLAPYPDNLWFWEQAGLRKPALLATAEKALKEAGVEPSCDNTHNIPCYGVAPQGLQDLKRSIPIAAELVPNPLSTLCLVVDKNRPGLVIHPGDILLLDTSRNDAKDLSPFWEKLVLVNSDPRSFFRAGTKLDIATDLRLGILRCKEEATDTAFAGREDVSWIAVLDPLDKSEPEQRADNVGFVVGRLVKNPPESLKGLLANVRKATHAQTTFEEFEALWPSKEIAEFQKEVRTQAPTEIRLSEYFKIVGCVIGWFRTPSKGGE